MSVPVALTKMHGARNDFAILDARAYRVAQLDALARRVCDRRTGLGADGLIVIEAPRTADVAMRTFNADGSEAEMCGNGIRCAARWLDEAGEGDRITFDTSAGAVRTEIVTREPVYLVRATMPAPHIVARSVEELGDATIVDTGNPHVVIFADGGSAVDVKMLGPRLQNDPRFPGGVNVHTVAVDNAHRLHVHHWERGVGTTPACGTGAVAAAAAAIDKGRARSPVEVIVPGGSLTVEWDGREALLTGPAVRVFDTVFDA